MKKLIAVLLFCMLSSVQAAEWKNYALGSFTSIDDNEFGVIFKPKNDCKPVIYTRKHILKGNSKNVKYVFERDEITIELGEKKVTLTPDDEGYFMGYKKLNSLYILLKFNAGNEMLIPHKHYESETQLLTLYTNISPSLLEALQKEHGMPVNDGYYACKAGAKKIYSIQSRAIVLGQKISAKISDWKERLF